MAFALMLISVCKCTTWRLHAIETMPEIWRMTVVLQIIWVQNSEAWESRVDTVPGSQNIMTNRRLSRRAYRKGVELSSVCASVHLSVNISKQKYRRNMQAE